jgi:gamma-glutamyl hercynylcysteine S-oxide synthase
MALKIFSRRAAPEAPVATNKLREPPTAQQPFEPADALTLDEDPLQRALQLERYGFILANRQRFKSHPRAETLCRQAAGTIDETFALVPEGFVSLPQTIHDYPGCPEVDVDTEPFLLARHTVTNAQFQKFVDAGGYHQLDLWPRELWPHLIDFRDQTDQASPRFWKEGRHDRRLADRPVVGISHPEAAAYASWAGYRLPTEAEWQMAASWRIRSSAHVLRRYPWGDALDTQRCNIWASGVGEPAPVTAYPAGAAPNGVLQLVGNVWEWTACDFAISYEDGQPVVGDMRMKSIRGGAFDTYFPSQATSCFRTGLAILSRTHNVGFRCALDVKRE